MARMLNRVVCARIIKHDQDSVGTHGVITAIDELEAGMSE
jgi:hypothetical protein